MIAPDRKQGATFSFTFCKGIRGEFHLETHFVNYVLPANRMQAQKNACALLAMHRIFPFQEFQ